VPNYLPISYSSLMFVSRRSYFYAMYVTEGK
jgi:hypothetical protein